MMSFIYNTNLSLLRKQESITKNKAFKDLEKYMSSFYAVARIALENEPQLLESLGKLVKS